MAYDVYPVLRGLSFSWVKRPKLSTSITPAVSGREVRLNYWTNPMWEWDLSYEYLPDSGGGWITTTADIKTMMAFYASHGDFQSFRFADPDDSVVTANPVAVGDGGTTAWVVTRTFGGGGFSTVEPIGYIDLSSAFHVYLNGVLQVSGYAVDQTTAYNQLLGFSSPPGAGVVVSVDMTFNYIVRFKENTLEFEKFMNKMWSLSKATLSSTRE